MRNLTIVEALFGKGYLNKWILERWKCFGKFDKKNPECYEFCSKQVMKRCKEKGEE